jgi:chromosome segregation ATPase
MPGNGDRETRLDRTEKALEFFIADHEQFRQDHKQLLIAQAAQQDQIEKNSRQIEKLAEQISQLRLYGREVEGRIDKLVLGIGEFIRSNSSSSPSTFNPYLSHFICG